MRWYVGTSGWGYARWAGNFYPKGIRDKERLTFYARHFNAVEINTTFYHLPAAFLLKQWESIVPEHFTFCIKASRQITHVKKLKDADETLPPFMERMAALSRPYPVVFQLPPRFHMNSERLEQFLQALPGGRRYAMEFRDPSWHDEAVYNLLRRHGVAFCLFEKGQLRSPRLVTADFNYVRLHGRKENYKGDYSRAELADWHEWLAEQGRDAYIFFDNTDEKMFAIDNALEFGELVKAAVLTD